MNRSAKYHAVPGAPLSRRRFLGTTVSAGTAGFSLPALLAAQGRAAEAGKGRPDTAVIQVWLGGGPSQFETYDPKPDAPAEIRGPFRAIPTTVPGVRFCEVLPRHAGIMDKVAVLRGVFHNNSEHDQAMRICTTGKLQKAHPSSGAYTAKLCPSESTGLPPYIHLGYNDKVPTFNPEYVDCFSAAYLGGAYNPFTVIDNPANPGFRVSNLTPAKGVTVGQVEDRKGLLHRFERLSRVWDQRGFIESMDHFNRAALDMITRPAARAAFDLAREPTALRERYGAHRWGQSCLLARRLVEAGVPFVTVNLDPLSFTFDMHASSNDLGITRGMQTYGPIMDAAIPTLIEDLHQRGLDRRVLVLVWGEFGRTPKMNERGGRDHWGQVMSVLLAGGRLKGGQIIGSSDRQGAVPKDRPLRPADVLATLYRHLGIDPHTTFPDPTGRPVPLLFEGDVIAELV